MYKKYTKAHKNNQNKKSQVAIFVIIGITLLVLIAMSMFFIDTSKDKTDTQLQFRDIDDIDDPVEKYVTECLKYISKDSIRQMGEHGGYVSMFDIGFEFEQDSPTESDGIILPITGNIEQGQEPYAIPYYYHMTSPSGCGQNCEFEFQIPTLYREEGGVSVESELDRYVTNNFMRCINNFEPFRRQGYTIKNKNILEVESEINDEDISFTLNFPLEVEKEGKRYSIKDFYYKHDINFMPTYELAVTLSALQMQYKYLEQHGLNLIGGYSGLDKEMPPFSDSTFEFGSPGRYWSKSKIASYFQNILLKYIQAIRVEGTNNYVEIGNEGGISKLMDTQMQLTLPKNYDREVYFNYLPFWPFYFDLNCDGEVCKPDSFSFSMLALMIGNQRYKFYYSTSYPVMVKIYDPNAFDGEGFNYFFALESNIKYNSAIREGENTTTDLDFAEQSLMCNENQRNSGEYNFTFVDKLTAEKIDDVAVYFTCGSLSCTIGKYETGYVSQKLPLCTQGVLTFEKQGYMSKAVLVQSYLDQSEDLGQILLDPLRKKNITLNKIKFIKQNSNVSDWKNVGSSPLEENQEAIIFLTKKDTKMGEKEFMQVVSLNAENNTDEIEIVPGLYEVSVTMIDRTNIIIPEDQRETGGMMSQSYTLPEFRFNESSPWLLGGMDSEFYITDIMDNHDKIILNVVSFDMKDVPEEERKIEDLEILNEQISYTNRYREQLGFRYE